MLNLNDKNDLGLRFYSALIDMATQRGHKTDMMVVIQLMAGIIVEMSLVYDQPDEAMEALLLKLSDRLNCFPLRGIVTDAALPSAHIMDFQTERGRLAARCFFEEWIDCEFELSHLMINLFESIFCQWEAEGITRAESLRLLVECVNRSMAYEITAQELCDIAIESKLARDEWSLADCVVALSAIAGKKLALSCGGQPYNEVCVINPYHEMDNIIHVMTQEAVRLGVPAHGDWRFGIPANDVPANAPIELIREIEPICKRFFEVIGLKNQYDQTVACAKAAGRMIAVAAGGHAPELEPVIAKPLALSAMMETYRSTQIATASLSR